MEQQGVTDEVKSPARKVPWYRQPTAKLIILRVCLRLIMLAAMVVILRIFGSTLKSWGYAYLRWIKSLGVAGGPLTFLCIGSVFSGLSPTGYMPSVAAGATFDYAISIPISFACAVLGALINIFFVRVIVKQMTCLHKLNEKCASTRKRARLGWTDGLAAALLKHPVRMTALIRLPFLGNGSLNYLLSRTAIPVVPMMLGNCLGMLPGAVLFAVMGTQARSLAGMIADGHAETGAIAVMVTLFVVSIISLIGVVWTTRRVMRKLKLAEVQTAEKQAMLEKGSSTPVVELVQKPVKEPIDEPIHEHDENHTGEEPNDENHTSEAKHCHHRIGRVVNHTD